MTSRHLALAAGGIVLAATLVATVGALGRPGAERPPAPPAPVSADEHAATIAALRPPKRARPVVAVLGYSGGTETTDYIVPYGVLRQSGVAEVVAVATAPGPLPLMPALTIQPQATTAEFDARHPAGADYVIVPAMHRADDPAVLSWVRAQAAVGATIVGVCDGTLVLAAAGLLDDHRATGHWYALGDLRDDHPATEWVRDRRFVVDRGVATTTGITASIPVSLALVEAIAGRARAEAVARELGVTRWNADHDSGAFRLDTRHVRTAAGNWLAFWSHETVGLAVEPGVDEIALALVADAWSRTYRSQAMAVTTGMGTVATRRGLTLVPDRGAEGVDRMLSPLVTERPAHALDVALEDIGGRYGRPTAAFVALQLEYPFAATQP